MNQNRGPKEWDLLQLFEKYLNGSIEFGEIIHFLKEISEEIENPMVRFPGDNILWSIWELEKAGCEPGDRNEEYLLECIEESVTLQQIEIV